MKRINALLVIIALIINFTCFLYISAAQATETPEVETPAVEIPVDGIPVVETPVVETPVVEIPVVGIPVVETPTVETPVVETPSFTNTYYVATDGDDANPGTISEPWKTIQKAADTINAGDTAYIRAGVYNERVVVKNDGSPNNYITFAAYSGEKVTIDGTNIDWGYDWDSLFDINAKSYIKVSGLKVVNSKWAGIGSFPYYLASSSTPGSNYVTVENCFTYNTKASGIVFGFASNIVVDSNTVEKFCTAGNNEGITMNRISNFEVRNNTVINGSKEGINAVAGCQNGKIYKNTVSNVYSVGIYVDAWNRNQFNIEVYDNTVYGCDKGISTATENGGLLDNVNIHNNEIHDCSWGFAIGAWGVKDTTHEIKNVTVADNSFNNMVEAGVFLANEQAQNIVISGNTINNTDKPIHLWSASGNLDVYNNTTTIQSDWI